jgi:hypothetical protein
MRKRLGWFLVAGGILALLVTMTGMWSKSKGAAALSSPVPVGVHVGAELSREEILEAMRRIESIAPKALMQADPAYLLLMHSADSSDEMLVELVGDMTPLAGLEDYGHYAKVGVIAGLLLTDRHYEATRRLELDKWFEANLEGIRDGERHVMKELKSRYWQAVLSDRGVKKTAMNVRRGEAEN